MLIGDDTVLGVGFLGIEYRVKRYLQFNGEGVSGPDGRMVLFEKVRLWSRPYVTM